LNVRNHYDALSNMEDDVYTMDLDIQWNIRSMNTSWEELNILLSDLNPDVIMFSRYSAKG